MLLDPTESLIARHAMIDAASSKLGMSAEALRIASWGCGGRAGAAELSAFLGGAATLPAEEYDALVAALNDRLIAAGSSPSLPYSEDVA